MLDGKGETLGIVWNWMEQQMIEYGKNWNIHENEICDLQMEKPFSGKPPEVCLQVCPYTHHPLWIDGLIL